MEPRYHLLNPGLGDGINIFFAGSGFEYNLAYSVGVRKRLLSWHANTQDEIDQFSEAQRTGRESFGIVDSGAFTVWNKGGKINVQDYEIRLLSILQSFDIAANLDVIPGKQGIAAKDITKQMAEDAAQEGWDNYMYLDNAISERHGEGRVMSIYHQGEPLRWLKKMVDHGCQYIGISPSNDYHTNQRMHWLDDVFDYLISLPKMPKTHGYAVTSPVLMKTYPWFSVDSASWIHQGGLGIVCTPFGNVTLTDRDDQMTKPGGWDSPDWSPEMKEQLITYFKSIGFDVEELKAEYRKRWQAIAIYMLGLETTHKYVAKKKETGLFDLMH